MFLSPNLLRDDPSLNPEAARYLRLIPGPLVVVVFGILSNMALGTFWPERQIRESEHIVSLPVATSAQAFFAQFVRPDFGALARGRLKL